MSIKIMSLAQSDNQLMVDLTKKAQNDAKTLKTITILTMVFLPASFVSVSATFLLKISIGFVTNYM